MNLKLTVNAYLQLREKANKNMTVAKNLGHRDKRAHIIWADTITLLFEEIARIVEVRQPIIETYYSKLI